MAVVAGLLLSTILVASGGVASGLRATGRAIVAPFSWTISLVARPFADLFAGAANYSDVLRQNEQLREELGLARRRAAEDGAIRRELAQLSAAAHLKFASTLSGVMAQVTSTSATNFAATITISKGSEDGVLTGMPVVSSAGLIGRITSESAHSATVTLITDPSSIVGCTWGHGATHTLVYGRGVGDDLAVSAVQVAHPIAPGFVFSTDALPGGLYPSGIPVAKVRTITLTPGTSTYDLSLTPLGDLRHPAFVDVLLWEPGS